LRHISAIVIIFKRHFLRCENFYLRGHARVVCIATSVLGADSEEVSGLKSLRAHDEPTAMEKSSDQGAQQEWRAWMAGFILDYKNAIDRAL
jgi:hypothetical protein